jgi:outer membrane beta-barrel protein
MRSADRNPSVTAHRLVSGRVLIAITAASFVLALAAFTASSPFAATLAVAPIAAIDSSSVAPDDSVVTTDDDETEIPGAVMPDSESGDDTMVPVTAGTAPAPAAATANPKLTAVRKVRLTGASRNVLRSGPGEQFSIVGVYPNGAAFPVIAKRGEWYGVRVSETETGWVDASLCKEFDDLSDLEFKPNPKLYSRTGTYVLLGYTGGYAFDRKSNSLVLGGRLGYYVFDRVQVEANVAWTHVHRPAEIVESLFGLSLEAEDFHMLFYALNLTYEVLPGRQMVPYVTGGVGSSIMQGDVEASVNFGAGTTLFLSKRSAMRWEVRDYRFHSGPADARRSNNNIEFSIGTQLLF